MNYPDFISSLLPGAVLGSALGAIVLFSALLLLSLDRDAPQGLGFWGMAFALNVLRLLALFVSPGLGPKASVLLSETLHIVVLLLFIVSTWLFIGKPVRRGVLLAVGSVMWLWLLTSTVLELGFSESMFPFYTVAAMVHLFLGWEILKASAKEGWWGGRFVALMMALWGVHKLNYPWLRPIEGLAPFGFALAELFALSLALGLLLMSQRRQSQQTEEALVSARDSEKRFQMSERQLTAVLHGLSDGVVTIDSKGIIKAVNPSASAMFGFEPGFLEGEEFDRLVPGGETMAQSLVLSGRNNIDGGGKGFECLGIRKDGSHVPLEMMAAEIPGEADSITVIKVKDTSDTKFSVRVEDLMVALTRAFVEGEGVNALMGRLAEGIASIFWVPLVWIGFCEANGRIGLKALSGLASSEPGVREILHLGEGPHAAGPTAEAIRSGVMQLVSVNDNPYGVMMDTVWGRGYQSVAVIPLSAHSDVVAALHVYSQTDHFPPMLLTVLDRLSGRLGLIIQAALDQERLQLMAAAMEASASAIVITDAKGGIEWGNAAYCRSSGYSSDEVAGKKLNLLEVKERGGSEYAELKNALDTGQTWHGEMVERRKDGSLYTVEQTVTPMQDAKGRVSHYVVVQEDLTEKRRAEERIRYLSHYDTLTALPNRHLFLERLTESVNRAQGANLELALLFIDLDQFSRVNDTLGHAAGDKLLIGVVERLRIAARAADTLARIGGDEFGIVLVDAKASEIAASLAAQINAVVAEPFLVDGHEAHLGVNVGIAVLPNDGTTRDDLVRNADLALYRCIREQPGSYRFFSQDMNDEARSRLGIERDLRRAIEQNEFVLHYQPQLSTKTGRIVGMEALVRWQHPERGMIPPGQFIPVAEDTGLIVPLGEWVLEQACKQARLWKDRGFGPFTMAVNISAVQFFRQDVVAVVRRILTESGLAPGWLELELTESMVMHDAEAAIHTLGRLNQLGIKMSIDDFGTGYSSLNYLRRFPVHRLKIDQSFVRQVTNSSNDAEIARAIISLGHSLELEVVSEGVETEPQLEYLKKEGADLLQGFLFSRPVAADAATDLLARQPFEKSFSNS